MGILLRALAVLAVAYLGYAGLMFVAQRWAMYPGTRFQPPGPGAPPRDAESWWLETAAGSVEAWYLPTDSTVRPGPAVMVFHGNAEFIDDWPAAVEPLRALGVAVLLVEYPGFGRSGGRPTQASIVQAAVVAYDRLDSRPEIDGQRIAALGRSLGAGVAAALAAERRLAALVLISPFSSVGAIARWSYRLPAAFVRDPFDTRSALVDYDGPVLIFHGRRDPVIPYRHALDLLEARPDARLVTWECGHNDCPPTWEGLWNEVAAFFRATEVLKADS